MMGPNAFTAVRSLRRDQSVRSAKVAKGTARRILRYVRPFRALLTVFLVVVVIDAVVSAANPLLYRAIIDQGILKGNARLIVELALLVAGLALADAALTLVQRYISARVGQGLIYDMRTQVFEHVQRMPLAFFTRTQTGALVSRLNNDVNGAQEAFTDVLSTVIGNLISVAIVLVIMFFLSWQLTLVSLILLPVFLLPARWLGRKLQAITRENYDLLADMNTNMVERFNVSGALLVKLFGHPVAEDEAFRRHAARVRDIGVSQAIRAFAAGNLAVLLSSIANGGLQFMLIMWLQGIWLPLHGYNYVDTPLWAGIYMLPLTLGFLVAGPVFGRLSDRYGARPFATTGMVLAALSFLLLMALPADFFYPWFAAVLFLNGLSFGMFAAPNTAAIMNSVPARNRGIASGMRGTMQSIGLPLSIGIFFSLMVVGLTAAVPRAMYGGLTSHHVPAQLATGLSHLPPTGYLFAAFLGYNPLQSLLGTKVLAALPHADALALIGKKFFPALISAPFRHGLVDVLVFAAVMCLGAALASWLRGGKFVHEEAHRHAAQTEAEADAPAAKVGAGGGPRGGRPEPDAGRARASHPGGRAEAD